MTTEKLQRKLTAILSADVEGYSRLMGDDEEATVRTLNKYKEMIFGLIERHNGRLVDSPGDNVLAEFASVVDAVRCGVQIQEDLKENNERLPPNRKMEFRIGINIGDVIQDGDRIYGDGVNVAARIESLADPGGICISRTAYDQVRKKLNIDYEYQGEYEVKNIDEPVRVYRVRMGAEDATPKAHVVKDVEEAAKTIAVLPFVNLSSDPEQEYFVDGLTEELLNTIAQIPDLSVTSRTSSFYFKGTNKKLQEIANELGVDNILEGSVRKAGNALRITAQLIRAADDRHFWSQTYDRELKDIFSVQEDIAIAVADELKVKLGIGESVKQLGGTDNVEAYELYLVAKGQIMRGYTFFDYLEQALETVDKAIAIDPEFALAWATKAQVHMYLSIFGPVNRTVSEQDVALNAAQRAIELEPNLGAGYSSFGFVKTSKGNWIEAEPAYRKALELPTETLSGLVFFIVVHCNAVGNFKRARELLEEIRQNDPLNPSDRSLYIISLALLGDTKQAEDEYERCKALFGDHWEDHTLSHLRLGFKDTVSRDEIVYSNSVWDVAREHLDSPKVGLVELHQLYSDDNNLSENDITDISILAAYFGDPAFALEIMEKEHNINASGLFKIWYPVMHEVRQTTRFKEFIREIGIVDYWNEFGWPDICHKLDNGDFECD